MYILNLIFSPFFEILDALYCPSVIADEEDDSIRVSSVPSSTQSTLTSGVSPPPNAPSLIQILLERVPKIPDLLNF